MTDPISLQPTTHQSLTNLAVPQRGAKPELPLDLFRDIARRLSLVCLAVLGISVLNAIAAEFVDESVNRTVRYGGLALIWTGSLAVFFLARSGRLAPGLVMKLGLGYEVFVAAMISVTTLQFGLDRPFLTWSTLAVWILIFPVIVPSPTRMVMTASIAAALSEPLVLLLFVLFNLTPMPAADVFARNLWPSVVAVIVAVFLSRIIYQLGQKLERARSLGSYQLIERLGVGGMGEVWKGTHRMLARSAAVKLIKPDALGGNDRAAAVSLKRFEREAQATAALRSAHTVELFDFGVSRDGTFYYVMEMLDGLDLLSLVERYGPQPPERVVAILRQACHSLHEAHVRGLIHRDIKPANIFLCRHGVDLDFVKVLDFGLVAAFEADEEEARLTQQGMVSGTPAFISPEAALGDQSVVDGRSDLYGLGCVMYWLLTGRTVFEKPSAMAMVVAHVNDQPTPISELMPLEVPEGLEKVVMQLLEKNPNNRPQTALELSVRLRDLDIEKLWTIDRAVEWWERHSGEAPTVSQPTLANAG